MYYKLQIVSHRIRSVIKASTAASLDVLNKNEQFIKVDLSTFQKAWWQQAEGGWCEGGGQGAQW